MLQRCYSSVSKIKKTDKLCLSSQKAKLAWLKCYNSVTEVLQKFFSCVSQKIVKFLTKLVQLLRIYLCELPKLGIFWEKCEFASFSEFWQKIRNSQNYRKTGLFPEKTSRQIIPSGGFCLRVFLEAQTTQRTRVDF